MSNRIKKEWEGDRTVVETCSPKTRLDPKLKIESRVIFLLSTVRLDSHQVLTLSLDWSLIVSAD